MKRIPQGRYSEEFRKEAVRLVVDQELSDTELRLAQLKWELAQKKWSVIS